MADTTYSEQTILNRVYDAPTNSLRVSGAAQTKGLYNPAGLTRFKQRIGLTKKRSDGTGEGGLDVILVGDSLLRGMAGATTRHDVISSYLRNQLQTRFNPSDVLGGAGLRMLRTGAGTLSASNTPLWPAPGRIPLLASTTATGTNGGTTITIGSSAGMSAGQQLYFTTSAAYRTILTVPGGGVTVTVGTALTTTNGETVQVVRAESSASYTGVWSNSSGNAISRMRSAASDSASNQARMLFLNTADWSTRQLLTSVDFVYGTESGGGIMTVDGKITTTDAAFATGTGDLTSTQSCDAASSGGNRKTLSGFLNTNSYMVQVSAPASGTIYPEGIIAYNGDESSGIRVHDACRVGMSTQDNWTAETLAATFDKFCTRNGRATNGELFIINIMTNDITLGTTIANFKTQMATILDRIGVTNNSSVLYVIPWLSDEGTLTPNPGFLNFRQAIYDLVNDGRTAWASILDMYTFQGEPTTTDAFEAAPTLWIDTTAGLHNTNLGNQIYASQIYAALTEGL